MVPVIFLFQKILLSSIVVKFVLASVSASAIRRRARRVVVKKDGTQSRVSTRGRVGVGDSSARSSRRRQEGWYPKSSVDSWACRRRRFVGALVASSSRRMVPKVECRLVGVSASAIRRRARRVVVKKDGESMLVKFLFASVSALAMRRRARHVVVKKDGTEG